MRPVPPKAYCCVFEFTAARPNVERRRDDVPGQLSSVRHGIPERPEQAELLAVPQREPHGTRRLKSEPAHLPGHIDQQGDVGPVVERARAKIPGVEMGADHHDLVGEPAAPNLADYVPALVGRSRLDRDAGRDAECDTGPKKPKRPRSAVPLHREHRMAIAECERGAVAVQVVAGAGTLVDHTGRVCVECAALDSHARAILAKQPVEILKLRRLDEDERATRG